MGERAVATPDPSRGPYTTTYSGRLWYLQNPDPSDVHLPDMVWHCSHLGRYCGGTVRLYTVLEHLVLGAKAIIRTEYKGQTIYPNTPQADVVLRYLAHDLHEAYYQDIGRALKALPEFEGYRALEAKGAAAVATALGLGTGSCPLVDQYDDLMAEAEMQLLTHPAGVNKWATPSNHPAIPAIRFGHKAARASYWRGEFATIWRGLWPAGSPQVAMIPPPSTEESHEQQ